MKDIEAVHGGAGSQPRREGRPDLLLLTQLGQRYRRAVSQAEQYRDDLISRLQPIDVLGKEFDARMLVNMPANVTLASYTHLISRARAELELQWLLGELTRDAAPTDTST